MEGKQVTPGSTISSLYGSMLPESTKTLLSRSDLLYTIRHDRLVIYKGLNAAHHGKKRDPLCTANLRKRTYNGELSESSIKHVSKQVTLWADSIENYNRYYCRPARYTKRKMIFVTLTLSAEQAHRDQEIKRKIWVPFIDCLRYNMGITNYFWRAEAQKNNNIHFHILLDKYIDKKTIQKYWNQTQEKLGYVSRFEEKHGHRNPPSTHVRAIDNHKNTIKYVLKYATKASDNRLITGKIWGMSTSIRCLLVPTFRFDKSIMPEIIKDLVNKEVSIFENEHYVSFAWKKPVFLLGNNKKLTSDYRDKLFMIYSYLYFEDSPFDDDPGMLIYQGLELSEICSITRAVKNYDDGPETVQIRMEI